ncbi:Uncharacterized protein Fot_12967 [Forsythia ovata]|uniref:Uncharacterized protein n=1 Tax=Forsythia ovata TaxID=205694 RepID=A0ABD1W249_9LAMI
MSVGGKASDQPKRTPVSQEEIESILSHFYYLHDSRIDNIAARMQATFVKIPGKSLPLAKAEWFRGGAKIDLGEFDSSPAGERLRGLASCEYTGSQASWSARLYERWCGSGGGQHVVLAKSLEEG